MGRKNAIDALIEQLDSEQQESDRQYEADRHARNSTRAVLLATRTKQQAQKAVKAHRLAAVPSERSAS